MEITYLPKTATFDTINKEVDKDKTIDKMFYFMLGNKPIQAIRKYTFAGVVIKASYLNIYIMDKHDGSIIKHYREQDSGKFELM